MKILIVKTSSLGDIIHAFPLLEQLRNQYPEATIDWVVEDPFAQLVQAHPAVNNVLRVKTKKWRKSFFKKETREEIRAFIRLLRSNKYDLLYDLQGNIKSGLITGAAISSQKIGFAKETVPELPNMLFTTRRYNPPKGHNIREDYLFLAHNQISGPFQGGEGVQLKISKDDEVKIQTLLGHPKLSKGKKILVCSGSNWTNKQLSKECLGAFLKKISQANEVSYLFAWGSPEEQKIANGLAESFPESSIVIDKLGLPALQNLMSRLDLVIAMDSLPLHLAGTTPTPTYSVFGASLSEKYKPLGQRHGSFQGACPYGQKFEKRCTILRTCSTGSCVKDIQPDMLYNHFAQWWRAYA
ncbi:MAG: lipopolysaccharide heptosyltransferase I [Parachlamydiaceae bacterium]|nr:lipopolysaccharide heptosyltransferase I [Parachlamydiaceae bacterium]